MTSPTHVQRVRMLYKYILRLHRGLPIEMRAMGDSYVRDEFRRHKDSEMDVARKFLDEWTDYCVTLTKQIGERKVDQDNIGAHLDKGVIDAFSDEQLGQLAALRGEATKPRDVDQPLGHDPRNS